MEIESNTTEDIDNQLLIPSINYHLWAPCNMKCKFCFARFSDLREDILPKGHLSKEDAKNLVKKIIDAKFDKITFVGGEPTLCKWLDELIIQSKEGGLTTMVVTNGSHLKEDWLNQVSQYLDWIVISIDSFDPATLIDMGRTVRNKPIEQEEYFKIATLVKKYGINLKINTVVTSSNYLEDMSKQIIQLNPIRWKILQMLPIKGQNDDYSEEQKISIEQFDYFCKLNGEVSNNGIKVVKETNDLMLGSYVMIDPAGRFFDNTEGSYKYSKPILEVGINDALSEIKLDKSKFLQREGLYEWKK